MHSIKLSLFVNIIPERIDSTRAMSPILQQWGSGNGYS